MMKASTIEYTYSLDEIRKMFATEYGVALSDIAVEYCIGTAGDYRDNDSIVTAVKVIILGGAIKSKS